MPTALLAIALSAALVSATDDTGARRIQARLLATPPTLDGVLMPGEWEGAEKAMGFTDPFTGKPAEEATEAWIGYDTQGIYAALYCHDSHPEQIVARETRPGAEFEGEDFVVLRLDPFFTRQSDSVDRFQVNPLGTCAEEIASGRAAKREWRGEWKAAAKRVPDGWIVEMFLPWRMLSYPRPGPEGLKMSVNFVRFYGRGKNREMWSNLTANFRGEMEGIWEGVKPPTPPAPKPQFLAYGLGAWDGDAARTKLDGGLDIKYQPTQQMTLIGALNPDFQNVEQQVENISFSRSERFQEDSRPFFAEGSGQFYMTVEYGMGRLFYSRRIADFDLGAKAYGRLNPQWSLGALATTGAGQERNAAFNLQRVLPNGGNVGVFGTYRKDLDRDDTSIGATVNERFGNFWLGGEAVVERDPVYDGHAHTYSISYSVPKLFSVVRHTEITEDFRPALGLIDFADRKGVDTYSEYNDTFPNRWINRVHTSLYAKDFEHSSSGQPFTSGFNFFTMLQTRTHQEFQYSWSNQMFEGQRDQTHYLGHAIGSGNRFSNAYVGYTWGVLAGEPYRYVQFMGTRRVIGKLDVGLSLFLEDGLGSAKQYVGTVGWEFDPKRALTGRWVRSRGKTNAYVAYRSGGFAGNELYVILGDPNAETFRQKLTVKFVWPF